jgi:magnesium chelatase family protein
MVARSYSFWIDGVVARRVCVEVDVRPGLPALNIVGMAPSAVRAARERIMAAIANCGYASARQRVTVNLAPAGIERSGTVFDLALACGLLAATGQVRPERLGSLGLFAELSLDGRLRPCRGALAAAETARRTGIRSLVVAPGSAAEAEQVGDLTVLGLGTLRDVVDLLDGRRTGRRRARRAPSAVARSAPAGPLPDLADVRGQGPAIAALILAAAGGHNLLMSGPPGVGKTMLARRLPSIMPPLDRSAAIEVTKLHGLAGLHPGSGLVSERPFRAPHHTISAIGLVGGGPHALPGEAVLAHQGVLFLDELGEFGRAALEALRQPLEDGRVAIVRRQRTAVYPARFMLVAATNPCPCGYAGSRRRCRCTPAAIERHRRKLSGPLIDRLDLLVEVRRPSAADLRAPPVTSSAEARARVAEARARQASRLRGSGATCNAQLDGALLHATCKLQPRAEAILQRAYERGEITTRGHGRVLRVARSAADLDGSELIRATHVVSALAARLGGRVALRRTG